MCARGYMIEVHKILKIYDKEVYHNLLLNNKLTQGHCYKLNKDRAQTDIHQYYLH